MVKSVWANTLSVLACIMTSSLYEAASTTEGLGSSTISRQACCKHNTQWRDHSRARSRGSNDPHGTARVHHFHTYSRETYQQFIGPVGVGLSLFVAELTSQRNCSPLQLQSAYLHPPRRILEAQKLLRADNVEEFFGPETLLTLLGRLAL